MRVFAQVRETMKNKVQVKIPGKSKELVEQRDTLGREIKKYGGDEDKLKYAFNVFLNPANTNKGKTSKAAEEIYEVYKGNIGIGLTKKKLLKLNQSQKANADAEFNKIFIRKTLKEILSQNIIKQIFI